MDDGCFIFFLFMSVVNLFTAQTFVIEVIAKICQHYVLSSFIAFHLESIITKVRDFVNCDSSASMWQMWLPAKFNIFFFIIEYLHIYIIVAGKQSVHTSFDYYVFELLQREKKKWLDNLNTLILCVTIKFEFYFWTDCSVDLLFRPTIC